MDYTIVATKDEHIYRAKVFLNTEHWVESQGDTASKAVMNLIFHIEKLHTELDMVGEIRLNEDAVKELHNFKGFMRQFP